MSIMGTFDTMTAARLAIYSAAKGLSVTGNNIANINTEGYTRQSLDQVALKTGGSDRYQYEYAAKVGNGVLCTGVSQARDSYLDIRYRTQMASVGSKDTKLTGLNNIADIIDEVGDGENSGDGIIEAQFNDLFEALENLDVNAGYDDYDAQVRASASSLCILLNSYSKKLSEVQENTVSELTQSVDSVNEILSNIRDLNSQIRKSEIHGDAALEMRDDRNVLIDQLAEYMKIDVTYSMEDLGGGQEVEKLTIRLGGANDNSIAGANGRSSDQALLVDGVYCTQLSLASDVDAEQKAAKAEGRSSEYGTVGNFANYDEDVDEYNVVLSGLTDAKGRSWSETTTISAAEFDAAVDASNTASIKKSGAATEGETFNIEEKDGTISTYTVIKDSDKSRASGTTVLGYTKTVTSQAYMLEDNDLYGSLQSYRELLTESGEYASATMKTRDADATTKRGIPYYQKALNSLAQQLASKFNEMNSGYMTDSEGNYLDANDQKIQIGTDSNGKPIYLNESSSDADIKAHASSLVEMTGGVLFSSSGTSDNPSGITASNISISQSWANGSAKIANSFAETVPGQGVPTTASDNIDRFVAAFSEKLDYYAHTGDTNPMFSGTFQEMLTNMSAILGNDVRSTNVLLDNYNAAATELNTSRDSVSGVDLNDEAMSLMTYQKSYAAACRLMTTLDEVLDKLINGTAI